MGKKKITNRLSEPVRHPVPSEGELGSPLDYFTDPRSERHPPFFTLPLVPPATSGDPDDLSTCSDFESGVADLSSHSSSAGDDAKEVNSDEVVNTNS